MNEGDVKSMKEIYTRWLTVIVEVNNTWSRYSSEILLSGIPEFENRLSEIRNFENLKIMAVRVLHRCSPYLL